MNSEDEDKLIQVYAENRVDEIEDKGQLITAKFKKKREELSEIPGFNEYKEIVKGLKKDIEKVEERFKTGTGSPLTAPTDQVIACLKLILNRVLYGIKDPGAHKKRIEILAELMRKTYGQGWGDKEKDHFEFLLPKLRDWNIFFLSYANSGASEINESYRDMIRKAIGEQNLAVKLNSEDWTNRNIVADLLIKQLGNHNFKKGFYDKKDIEAGEMLLTKIKPECEKSLLFIQLVTTYSFGYDEKNWSFDEYTFFKDSREDIAKDHPAYKSTLDDSLVFAVCVDGNLADVKPEGIFPYDYTDWFDDMSHRVHKTLPSNDVEKFDRSIADIAKALTNFLEKKLISCIP